MSVAASPARATGPADDPAAIVLVGQTPWVADGEPFVARIRVDDPPVDAQLSLTVHRRLPSRAAFGASLFGAAGPELASVSVGLDLAPESAEGIRTIAVSPETIALPEPGVYPLALRVAGSDGNEHGALLTHIVRVPEPGATARLALAVVVPFHGALTQTPTGTEPLPRPAVGRLTRRVAALAGQPDVPVVVRATPETAEALERPENQAAGSPTGDLASVATAGQLLTSPYIRLDLAAWERTGLDDTLRAQIGRGEDVLADSLEVRPDGRTWVAEPTITPNALDLLRGAGVDQVVLPESVLSPVDEGLFPTTVTSAFEVATADNQTLRGAVADRGLSSHIEATGNPALDAYRVIADLALIAEESPTAGRGAVLSVPVTARPGAAFYPALLEGLAVSPTLDTMTLDEWFTRVPLAAADGTDSASGERLVRTVQPTEQVGLGDYPRNLGLTGLNLRSYAGIAGPDNPRVAPLSTRLFASGAQGLSAEQRSAYLRSVDDAVRTEVAGITAPARQTVTLTSRSGTVPYTVNNDTGYPVSVAISFDSDKLDFPEGDRVEVMLEEGPNTIEVEVRSRASGAFPLDIAIGAPDDVLDLARTRVTFRSTALSGVGVAIAVVAGIVLLGWWARHFRDGRQVQPSDPA